VTPDRQLFDRTIWMRFRRAVSGFTTSPVGGQAKGWFAGLLTLLVATNTLNVVNSYVGRDFMTAIEHRDHATFIEMALLYLGVFALSTIVAAFYRFCEERLGLLWREWLTRRAVDLYLTDGAYYRMRERREIENPDQRISEDVRFFTTTTLSFLLMGLNATFSIIAFSGVLWTISPTLFVVGVAYAASGTALTAMFGRPLVALNYHQLDREADLRAELLHFRDNAESIALLHNELQLRAKLRRRIREVIANTRRIVAVNRNLTFFTSGYNYLIQIIPALIVAPLFIRGDVEFGVIPQSAMAFSHLLNAFSLFVTQFQSISSYAAVLARLANLDKSLQEPDPAERAGIERTPSTGPLVLQHLSLVSPRDGRILVRELDATIETGSRLLVSSPSATAKLALFRALAGIWTSGTGRILHPPDGEIQFLAERPYLPRGTLREVLTAGRRRSQTATDADIQATLASLQIESIAARAGGLDSEREWESLLPFAEQQLIALARALLASPRVIVMHELTSALGPDQIACCLGLFARKRIGYLVLGELHDELGLCDAVLEIARNGTWRFTTPQTAQARV
jgi:putative ATP-binding cassette transporter